MTERITVASPRVKARIAGVLYLIVIAGGIFAELFVRGRLVVHGDPAATAHNILTHELLFRLGFAVEIFYCACNVPLIFIFYDLFKIVNRTAAALAAIFGIVGTAVESACVLAHIAPLLLLTGTHTLSGFSTEQLQAASYVSLQLFERGFAIALVFFGGYCLSFGYLIVRSTFFPRIIGFMLAVEGLCYLINSFANFLAPGFAARIFSLLMVAGLGEVSLCLWLLIVGVNIDKWNRQARRDAGAPL